MRKNKNTLCMECRNELDKNAIGLNYKYLGTKVTRFYCINCLSEHLGIGVDDLYRQIEYFKAAGCTFFD